MSRAALVAVVVAGCLVAAGCGDSDSSDDDKGAAVSPSAPASTPSASNSAGRLAKLPDELNFTGKTIDGKAFNGPDLAEKPVVFWFWAPWCPKCKSEAPAVAKAAAKFKGRVEFVGISGKAKRPAMKTFVRQTGTGSFAQLDDSKGEIWRKFGVTVQSSYVFMNVAGKTSTASGPLSEGDLAKHIAKIGG